MKKIKLFLTSSLDKLEKDIQEFGAFIDSLNDNYQRLGIYFYLNISGENDPAEDLKAAANSELFYIIFHDEPQEKAKAEFEAAYNAFINKKTPKICTYYKKLDNKKQNKTVINFMEKLRNELGHYDSSYTHLDTLKLNLILQLKTLGLEHIKVDVNETSLLLDGQELMTLENIPIIFNNKNLSLLKNEFLEIEKEFMAHRALIKKNPDDDDLLAEYLGISGRKNKASEAIHNLQLDIIKMETSFLEKSGTGYISPRQISARQCLEEGDIEGAKQILSVDELELEEKRELEILEEHKKKIQALVGDWMQRVDVLIIDTQNENRFTEIEHSFEKAIKLEKEAGLERESQTKFVEYLIEQRYFDIALKHAQDYLKWAEIYYDKTEECLYRIAEILQNIGLISGYKFKFDDAEYFFKKSIDISDKINQSNQKIYNYKQCKMLNNYGEINFFQGKMDAAKDIFLKNVSLMQDEIVEKSFNRLRLLADTYCNIGMIYSHPTNYKTAQYSDAEHFMMLAKNIYSTLDYEDTYLYQIDLGQCYSLLGSLYLNKYQLVESEEYFKLALILLKKGANINPNFVEPYLMDLHRESSHLYYLLKQYTEGIEQVRCAIKIGKRLINLSFDTYIVGLATAYGDLGKMLSKTHQYTESIDNLIMAIEILESLDKEVYFTIEHNLGFQYYYISLSLYALKNYPETEKYYHKAINITERLFSTNPDAYREFLSNIYANYAILLKETSLFPEALEYCHKALSLRETLLNQTPDVIKYKNDLAKLFYDMGLLSKLMQEQEQAIEYFKQAFDLWETMDSESIGENKEFFTICKEKKV
ncbi:MAG: tetratricopeptide repeat protein [Candidatus Cloacimonetes bacterium]|nr:tetratricopeptide repeat protein [Candidatus Cloacimonadota bacterium]